MACIFLKNLQKDTVRTLVVVLSDCTLDSYVIIQPDFAIIAMGVCGNGTIDL